jgi:CRP-like cAMP-binding protein
MFNIFDLESVAYFQKKAYEKDEVIFDEGEENTFLYVVLE